MNSSAPAPDPQIGQASLQQIQLAQQEYNDQHALVQQYSPLFQQEVQQNLTSQQQQSGESQEQWGNYQKYFEPVEQDYAQKAASFDTPAREDEAAQQAGGSVATSFDAARAQQQQQLAAAGLQPGSGKGLALGGALNIQEARAKAGAMTAARQQTEAEGLNLESSASNLGRGLPGQSLAFSQGAQSAGGAAQGSVGGLSGLTGAETSYAIPGMSAGISGLVAENNLQQQQAASQQGFFGDLLGAGMQAYGMYASSKKLKTAHGPVSGKKAPGLVADRSAPPENDDDGEGDAPDAAPAAAGPGDRELAGLTSGDVPVDKWTYKPGQGDGRTHIGPYAEDVNAKFGDRVAPGGKAINVGAMEHDVNGPAITALTRKVLALKRELRQLEAA